MSIHWVGMRSRGGRRRSHLFMEGIGGHIALFVSALGALLAWLRASRRGSATLNVFLVIAIAAICIVGWKLVTSSSDSPTVANPGGSQSPQSSLATPQELTLRTPVQDSTPAASEITKSQDGADVPPPAPVLDEEAWRQSFANASVQEILAAAKALRAEVEEKSGPIIDSMHAAGHSEYLGPEYEYQHRVGDEEAIFRIYMSRTGGGSNTDGTYRMELPRTHYPEIYALKARALWLEELARKKKQG